MTWNAILKLDRIGFGFQSVIRDLLVERVAVDTQAGGRFCLNSLARFQDLSDQLFFDQRDDSFVEVRVSVVRL